MSNASKPGWFCGAALDLPKRMRLLLFLLLLILAACLCYSQFGIVAFGNESTGEVNLALLLVPAALCVAMLGVVPGVALAFAMGMLVMFRAWWAPITQYDFQMADPFLSVVDITLGAMLMAAIVAPAARRWPADLASGVSPWRRIGPLRVASIAIGCFAFSFAYAYISRGIVYLFVTPGGAEYDYATVIQEYLSDGWDTTSEVVSQPRT